VESQDSGSSEQCVVCGQLLPTGGCEVDGCQAAAEAPPILAHEGELYRCAVCDRDVVVGETCDRSDCPRVAADQIRKASVDTPFKLGL
jgi:hypothetical protein